MLPRRTRKLHRRCVPSPERRFRDVAASRKERAISGGLANACLSLSLRYGKRARIPALRRRPGQRAQSTPLPSFPISPYTGGEHQNAAVGSDCFQRVSSTRCGPSFDITNGRTFDTKTLFFRSQAIASRKENFPFCLRRLCCRPC